MKRNVLGTALVVVGLAMPAVAPAQVAISPGPPLTIYQATVNDGPGGQTDPHVSGEWVTYTDQSIYSIRFQNLDLGPGSDRIIPHPDATYDALSDVFGGLIAFQRTVSSMRPIELVRIDALGNPGPAVEVSPLAGAVRRRAAVGGDTIAYEDWSYSTGPLAQPEISLSSASDPTAPAYRLTSDDFIDAYPAVGPDGNAVVWVKCETQTTCHVFRAERTNGTWGAPEQVTGGAGHESLPDTNGPVTVYGSNSSGDDDIHFAVKSSSGGYTDSHLALPGVQRNPNIAGDFVVFESSAADGAQFDLLLFDLSTSLLYQLTDTTVTESLSDVTTGPGGLVRVVWASPKLVTPYDMDVYALATVVPRTPPCETEPPADPAQVCADPGTRSLLADVQVVRTTRAPNVQTATFASATTEGVLCVASSRATSGSIVLNGAAEVGPESFAHGVESIAREVPLAAENVLSASIAGKPGTSYEVRVYGSPRCEAVGTELSPATLLGPGAASGSVRQAAARRVTLIEDGARAVAR